MLVGVRSRPIDEPSWRGDCRLPMVQTSRALPERRHGVDASSTCWHIRRSRPSTHPLASDRPSIRVAVKSLARREWTRGFASDVAEADAAFEVDSGAKLGSSTGVRLLASSRASREGTSAVSTSQGVRDVLGPRPCAAVVSPRRQGGLPKWRVFRHDLPAPGDRRCVLASSRRPGRPRVRRLGRAGSWSGSSSCLPVTLVS
jgi:hypothetical protein